LQSAGPKFVKILQQLIESIDAQPGPAADLPTMESKTSNKHRKDRSHG
jgi:hypothetical protein